MCVCVCGHFWPKGLFCIEFFAPPKQYMCIFTCISKCISYCQIVLMKKCFTGITVKHQQMMQWHDVTTPLGLQCLDTGQLKRRPLACIHGLSEDHYRTCERGLTDAQTPFVQRQHAEAGRPSRHFARARVFLVSTRDTQDSARHYL